MYVYELCVVASTTLGLQMWARQALGAFYLGGGMLPSQQRADNAFQGHVLWWFSTLS